jgi:hypothetical protein
VAARFLLAVFLGLMSLRAARAEGSLLPDGHLDTAVVRDAYLRSDIPFVRSALEAYLRSHPKDVSAAEKVFTHLYLGATFAGDPEGRGRSEAHFRAALKFAPDTDPSGLYLPPAAVDWFESLRAEARIVPKPAASAMSSDTDDAPAASAPAGSPSPAAPPASGPAQVIAAKGPRGWIWWAVGGGVAVAAGAGAFVWIESRSESPPHRVQVDATLK